MDQRKVPADSYKGMTVDSAVKRNKEQCQWTVTMKRALRQRRDREQEPRQSTMTGTKYSDREQKGREGHTGSLTNYFHYVV